MAISKRGQMLPGVLAAADFTSAQHRFVSLDSNGDVALTAAGARMDGALENNPDIGQPATVMGPGSVAKVEASAAIASGADVASAANGQAVTSATGNYIAGPAMTATGASGEIVSVWLIFPGRTP